MPRENAAVKARRLLGEGRVVIRHVGDRTIFAQVRGDSAARYEVTYDGQWWCTCPARTRCSHVRACQLVVLVTDGGGHE